MAALQAPWSARVPTGKQSSTTTPFTDVSLCGTQVPAPASEVQLWPSVRAPQVFAAQLPSLQMDAALEQSVLLAQEISQTCVVPKAGSLTQVWPQAQVALLVQAWNSLRGAELQPLVLLPVVPFPLVLELVVPKPVPVEPRLPVAAVATPVVDV